MAGSLESVLAGIPFLGGYEAQNQQNRAQEQGDLVKAHTLQGILRQIQQRDLDKKFAEQMASGGGTPEQIRAMAAHLAASGHPGAPSLAALADKKETAAAAAADAQAQMR